MENDFRYDGIGFKAGQGRRETDPCERGTVGCCVRHQSFPVVDHCCETW
jgi:hypothetical protein